LIDPAKPRNKTTTSEITRLEKWQKHDCIHDVMVIDVIMHKDKKPPKVAMAFDALAL
jgi:hypothetical protein